MHGPPKDRAYRLKVEESPPAGMRRIATGRIEKALERLAKAQEAEDPTSGVHGVRKDLKKLRSELRLLRHESGKDLYRAENGSYREAGRLLSESRDAEVKVETLADICERGAGTLPPGAAEEWIDTLREERDLAVASTRDGAGSTALGEAMKLIEAGSAGRLLAAGAGNLEARRAGHRPRLPARPQADAAHRRRAERRQRPRVAQAGQGPLVPAAHPRGRDPEEAPRPRRRRRPPRRRADDGDERRRGAGDGRQPAAGRR